MMGFMTAKRREGICLGALFALLLALFCVLPFAQREVYASPDETANAVVAHEIAAHGRAYLLESFTGAYPWLHPRSWVSVGGHIAPVGFLGWPAVLAAFVLFGGTAILPWVGMLLILSSVWPFFRLLRRFGFAAAWWGTLVAFTTPNIILYANRSLFANGPVLALAVWGFWLLTQLAERHPWKRGWAFGATSLCVLALALRPSEALWIVPWWAIIAYRFRPTRREWIEIAGGALVVILPLLWLAHGAYGSWFGVGYAARDPVVASVSQLQAPRTSIPPSSPWWIPYGFHPRNLLWNVGAYLGWLFLPWSLLFVSAFVAYWRRRTVLARVRRRDGFILLSLWTFAVLLLVYGSGLYADRIGPRAATIANSFLRYFLPVGLLCGWGFAYLWRRFGHWRWVRIAGIVFGIGLAVFGAYRAYFADDEGIWSTRQALTEYRAIRTEAARWFAAEDTIFSDRSDKIFFPAFRAVSPVPSAELVSLLARTGHGRVGLFSRPMSQAQKDEWRRVGLDVHEFASFARERLYWLVPSSL